MPRSNRSKQRRVRVILPEVGSDSPQVSLFNTSKHVPPPLLAAAADHRAGHCHAECQPIQALTDLDSRQTVQLVAPSASPLCEQLKRLLQLGSPTSIVAACTSRTKPTERLVNNS